MAQTIPPIPGQVITPPDPRKAPGSMTDPWYAWFNAFKGFVAGGGGGGGAPGPNSITNAQLAQAPGLSVKCNPTNVTANEQDLVAPAGNEVLQSNAAGTALVWGPFGTGVQVRGATWSGANTPLRSVGITDVTVVNPIDMQVTRVSITTKGGTGSCVCDVWTAPVPSYPTAANSIFTVLPSISSGTGYDDVALGGLSTRHIPAGNYLTFHLASSSVFTEVVINIALTPTQTVASSGYTDAQAVAAVKAAMTNTGNVLASGGVGAITLNDAGVTGGSWSLTAANNGSMGFPNGMIWKWGQFTLPSGAGQSITFPGGAFPNHVFSCVCSQGDSTGYGYPFGVDTLTLSGFTVVNSAGGINAGTGYYIAIGN